MVLPREAALRLGGLDDAFVRGSVGIDSVVHGRLSWGAMDMMAFTCDTK